MFIVTSPATQNELAVAADRLNHLIEIQDKCALGVELAKINLKKCCMYLPVIVIPETFERYIE